MLREAEIFKVLSDATRLRLMALLAAGGETCVCKLAMALDEPDYKVSRHLGVLRSAGLVGARRKGSWMYYRLLEGRGPLEKYLQGLFRDCLGNHKIARKDLGRLEKIPCREEGEICG